MEHGWAKRLQSLLRAQCVFGQDAPLKISGFQDDAAWLPNIAACFNENVIGAIDIGGTKVAVGVADDEGRLLAKRETATAPLCRRGSEGISEVHNLLAECAEGSKLSGIGISCTGPVDPFSGVIGNADLLPGWMGINLVDEFSSAFQAPVAVENDADACALAESAWGAGKGKKRFLYLTISTGIGGGIVLDGSLYRGACGAHPEVGHHVVEASGPPCCCGSRGCWESVASGPAMAAWVAANAPAGYAGNLDARGICEMALAGDELALRAVEREALFLGIGLANMLTLFAPDAIALGGGVMRSWPLFEERVRQTIRKYCAYVSPGNTELTPALLGPDIALIGAACVWRSRPV